MSFRLTPRMIDFIAKAHLVQNRDEAQALSDEELDWIYAAETAKTGIKNAIQNYRKALKDAGLSLYFVDMPMSLYREGDSVFQDRATKENKIRGTFREREESLKARKQEEATAQDDMLELAHDLSLLEGRVEAYLERIMTLCRSFDVEACAIGLLAATGRRNEEIGHTAQMMSLGEPYHVAYAGQLKTGSEERFHEVLDIAVLVPSPLVCERLAYVQGAVAHQLGGHYETFDGSIGREWRRAVYDHLGSLFPLDTRFSPRTLRNFQIAISVEAITPEGKPLCTGDVDRFIARQLGHKEKNFRPSDHYKRQLLSRIRHNYVLPS